ncbi:hypothetical protein Q7689_00685 [Nocardiopsis tropica]|uniref:hypothetical protein n=1 Tax=Nocardiopsis tropica TaxID=109330 RepID=UPI002E8274C8|nr:hypothetical protein [Nocardiopsis tropica]
MGLVAGLDPVRAARLYGLPHVIDYGPDRAGDGLLITTGAGLLLADMDELPTLRWAVDIGASRGHLHAADWAAVAARTVTHTVAHLWMAITDPAWMRGVLEPFPADRLAMCSRPRIDIGHQAATVEELAIWCEAFRHEPVV